jgi:hypothetical protein
MYGAPAPCEFSDTVVNPFHMNFRRIGCPIHDSFIVMSGFLKLNQAALAAEI